MSIASSGRRSDRPPEFFVDRSLGVTVTTGLRNRGWIVREIEEHFAHRAEETSDSDWVRYGCESGWALLTKDKKIRRQEAYDVCTRPIFALSDGNLPLNDMIVRFTAFKQTIERHARSSRREFWVVYANEVVRRD